MTEIRLVQRGSSGVVILTRDGMRLKEEAQRLGSAACEAFNEQVARQTAALETQPEPTPP